MEKMIQKSPFKVVLLGFLSILFLNNDSWAQSENPDYEEDQSGVASTAVETKETNLSLADYLRRVAGIQVRGSGDNVTVFVRGGSGSAIGSNAPLFVIDNNQIGNNYNAAKDQVEVNDIKYVEVLKDVASTNRYGLNGANGVIHIHTKKQKAKPKKKKKKKEKEQNS